MRMLSRSVMWATWSRTVQPGHPVAQHRSLVVERFSERADVREDLGVGGAEAVRRG